MKKIVLISCLLSLVSFGAHAVVDVYVGATASAGSIATYVPNDNSMNVSGFSKDDIMKSSGTFGAVVGINIPVVRFEAEYGYLTSTNMNLNVGMINGYLKLLPTPVVKPYVGFGLGKVMGGKIRGLIQDSPDASMPIQGMLGLQIELPALPIGIDVEARAMYVERIYTMPIVNRDIGVLQGDLRVKLRYIF